MTQHWRKRLSQAVEKENIAAGEEKQSKQDTDKSRQQDLEDAKKIRFTKVLPGADQFKQELVELGRRVGLGRDVRVTTGNPNEGPVVMVCVYKQTSDEEQWQPVLLAEIQLLTADKIMRIHWLSRRNSRHFCRTDDSAFKDITADYVAEKLTEYYEYQETVAGSSH